MSGDCDVAVVGAGHNALISAALIGDHDISLHSVKSIDAMLRGVNLRDAQKMATRRALSAAAIELPLTLP